MKVYNVVSEILKFVCLIAVINAIDTNNLFNLIFYGVCLIGFILLKEWGAKL